MTSTIIESASYSQPSKKQRRLTLTLYCIATSLKASLSLPQPRIGLSTLLRRRAAVSSSVFCQYLRATRALHSSGAISSSAICVLSTCTTKSLADSITLLVRKLLVGFATSSSALLRFRPRLIVSAVSSSASGGLLSLFRSRFFLPLASRTESLRTRFARGPYWRG
jgi:hypothetical protein